jgi:hypothetical protein
MASNSSLSDSSLSGVSENLLAITLIGRSQQTDPACKKRPSRIVQITTGRSVEHALDGLQLNESYAFVHL